MTTVLLSIYVFINLVILFLFSLLKDEDIRFVIENAELPNLRESLKDSKVKTYFKILPAFILLPGAIVAVKRVIGMIEGE